MPNQDYFQLKKEIQSFINTSHESKKEDAGLWNTLAKKIFAWQWTQNIPYQNYCRNTGIENPSSIASWTQIPALTTEAFKESKFAPSAFTKEDRKHTFFTSGTTGEKKGAHHFHDLDLYQSSILKAWEQLEMPPLENFKVLLFSPNPRENKNSSLLSMFQILLKNFSSPPFCLMGEKEGQGMEGKGFANEISQAKRDGKPVLLLGTALLYWRFMQANDQKNIFQLPKGSMILETGGFKGIAEEISKEQLYSAMEAFFGVEENSIINEYSMTELSSQCYTRGVGRRHKLPHWLKFQIINPENAQPVSIGEQGQIAFYDLANLGSVMAIQTQDMAILEEDGFFLLGRNPSALPRGCSRSADEMAQKVL